MFNTKILDQLRDGAAEEEVDDIQEVRDSNPCKGGEITYFELW